MYPKEPIPKDIFHYTRVETALEKILSQQKLRFGQLGFTNDPRESKSWNVSKPYWINPDVTQKSIQNKIAAKAFDNDVPEIMQEEWKVLCFTLDHEIFIETNDPSKSSFRYLNPGYAHPRMWAQYAENHRGVCLWFDGNKLDENINQELGKRCKIFDGNVHYNIAPGATVFAPFPRTFFDDIQNLGKRDAARKYIFDNYQQFFLRKYPDWESETEYRWLIHSKRRGPEYVSIVGAIKGVLVGVDFPKVYEPSLQLLCEGLGIPAGKVYWDNGAPRADFESINKA